MTTEKKTTKKKITYPKLRKAFKTKWLKALRSGEFQQEYGQLRTRTFANDNAYCCLGVACEVVGGAYSTIAPFPPNKVLDKMFVGNGAAIRTEASQIDVYSAKAARTNVLTKLAHMNDESKLSFKSIANWIEKNL